MSRLRGISVVVCGIAASLCKAGVINGSFEDGIGGWSAVGYVSVVDGSVGAEPASGSRQALLETGDDGEPYFVTQPNLTATAETVLVNQGIDLFSFPSAPSLDGIVGAASIEQVVSVSAGDELSFMFNFLTRDWAPPNSTTDPLYDDFSWVQIQAADGSYVRTDLLGDAIGVTTVFDGEYAGQTGYLPYHVTFPESGTYRVVIGVFQKGDAEFGSGILVDNVAVTAVPELSGAWMAAVGMVLLVILWMFRRRRVASGSVAGIE